MSQHDLAKKAEALKSEIRDLASELRDKDDLGTDRITAIEAEITAKSAALDKLEAEQRDTELDSNLEALDERLKAFTQSSARTKAAAILAVVDSPNPPGLLVLGTDAFSAFGKVAEAQRAELDQWQELSTSTDID